MAIPTKESLSGFIKSTPRLTRTSNGNARFFAWTGIPQSEYDGAGNYTELEPSEAPLVMFGASAERAHEQFRKGDNFIAEGKTGTWNREVEGQQVEEQQFIASRIGHDNNISRYTVERRAPEHQAERETPARDAAQTDAAQADAAHTEAAQPEVAQAETVQGHGEQPPTAEPRGADLAPAGAEAAGAGRAQADQAAAGVSDLAGGPLVGEAGRGTAAPNSQESAGVQAQVAKVLAQREAQVTAEPGASPGPAQPGREAVGR